ncbi:MBL fold metallo-hydrolase [Pyxidicoccus fallax]|uniref:MBL fold metallo-hydrolase n=1 Tax=Pyxidicoccus fallax TaxID=394095 RepID=A0A848LK10_9BACT|nr:MBL fold metallo-hydrolase [Pyxidicoccus fallax]NMO18043.1 MBL fold metallo-hydrolase [Pyxidicoccus fallax]NPC78607.1 MBL fold metallo-hydrolase [Pyxidicoccus fallax]
MRLALVASLAVIFGPGCFPHRSLDEDGNWYSNSAQEQGDARVGQYISGQFSFATSSYWIEGPDGLILIDTQFVPTALRKLIRFGEWTTGKKVKLAIVLHPNPDRFNGTAWVKDQGVPVVTSEQVLERIPDVHARWAPVFAEKYATALYPRNVTLPDSFGRHTTELTAGGVTVKAHVLGGGCSPAHVAVEWEGHLFVGDLVANGTHSWFENGSADAWLQRLDELRALNPKWIHPGHGPTGGPELLDQQREYVQGVVDAVAAEHPRGASSPEALARIKDTVTRRNPHRAFPHFLPMFLGAEWARQAALASPTP